MNVPSVAQVPIPVFVAVDGLLSVRNVVGIALIAATTSRSTVLGALATAVAGTAAAVVGGTVCAALQYPLPTPVSRTHAARRRGVRELLSPSAAVVMLRPASAFAAACGTLFVRTATAAIGTVRLPRLPSTAAAFVPPAPAFSLPVVSTVSGLLAGAGPPIAAPSIPVIAAAALAPLGSSVALTAASRLGRLRSPASSIAASSSLRTRIRSSVGRSLVPGRLAVRPRPSVGSGGSPLEPAAFLSATVALRSPLSVRFPPAPVAPGVTLVL